jgi:hypothetical protein
MLSNWICVGCLQRGTAAQLQAETEIVQAWCRKMMCNASKWHGVVSEGVYLRLHVWREMIQEHLVVSAADDKLHHVQ